MTDTTYHPDGGMIIYPGAPVRQILTRLNKAWHEAAISFNQPVPTNNNKCGTLLVTNHGWQLHGKRRF